MKNIALLGAFWLTVSLAPAQTPAEIFLNQYDARTQQVILQTLSQAFTSWTVPTAAAGYLKPYESSIHLLSDLNASGNLSRDQVFTLAHYVLDTLNDAQLEMIATQVDAEEIFTQEFINKYGSFTALIHQIYSTGKAADSIQVVEGSYELGIVAGTLTFDRMFLLQTLKSQLSTAQTDYLSVAFDQAIAATPDTLSERLGNYYSMFTDERQERVQYFAAILMAFLQTNDPATRTDLLPFWGWSYFSDYNTDGTLSADILGRTLLESLTSEQLLLLGLVVPRLQQMDAVLGGPDQGLIMALNQLKTTGTIDGTQYFEDITNWYLALGLQANAMAPIFAATLCTLSDDQVNGWSGLTSLDLLLAYKQACPVTAINHLESQPLRLFPNPVYDQIQLSPDETLSGPVDIRIWNGQGQEIWKKHFQQVPLSLDASSLPEGLLFLEMNSESVRYTGKILKARQ